MGMKITVFISLMMTSILAMANENYHQYLFDEATKLLAEQQNKTIAIYCTIQHFDTAPTAFQAQVLTDKLEDMKRRDPQFKTFYDTVRNNSSNNIYTDRQIVLMYIDKREVNKD
jgi:Na+-transporting NADH:ubiquinone oxidoreductase subunit NqrB